MLRFSSGKAQEHDLGCSQIKWQEDYGKYLKILLGNFKLHKHSVEGILQLLGWVDESAQMRNLNKRNRTRHANTHAEAEIYRGSDWHSDRA